MKHLLKSFLAVVALTFATSAIAGPHYHRHNMSRHQPHWHHNHHNHHHWHHNHGWVAPLIIGGALGYALTRPQIIEQPVVVQQAPVVLQQNQVVIDGVVYNKQVMIVNGIEQEVFIRVQ